VLPLATIWMVMVAMVVSVTPVGYGACVKIKRGIRWKPLMYVFADHCCDQNTRAAACLSICCSYCATH
jgi:hypothetical protein